MERMMDAQGAYMEELEAAMQADYEADHELEEWLVSIFQQADADGSGHLEPKEFVTMLKEADLGLTESEIRQMLAQADANGDGKIEYAEFAPLGADIIQVKRLKRLNDAEQALAEEHAEMQARATLHGFGQEQIVKLLLDAFRHYDGDNSGRLEKGEVAQCLRDLSFGKTKLAPREIEYILRFIDEDGSGTIEYNEIVPLMFTYMVEAFKRGFLESEEDELTELLMMHLHTYDASQDGCLPRKTLKGALADFDLVPLTPVQLHQVLANASVEADETVRIAGFAPAAARMMRKFVDPTLAKKRQRAATRAKVTPLGALTPQEKEHLKQLAMNVFSKYDEDGSGKLERHEFHKCLVEGELDLDDQQVSALMMMADENDDGAIDYAEFADLFYDFMLERSRAVAIDRMLEQEHIQSVVTQIRMFVEEAMIPFHIAIDIASEGQDTCPVPKVVDILLQRGPEWGLMNSAVEALAGSISRHAEPTISFSEVSKIVRELANEAAGEGGAPTGEAE